MVWFEPMISFTVVLHLLGIPQNWTNWANTWKLCRVPLSCYSLQVTFFLGGSSRGKMHFWGANIKKQMLIFAIFFWWGGGKWRGRTSNWGVGWGKCSPCSTKMDLRLLPPAKSWLHKLQVIMNSHTRAKESSKRWLTRCHAGRGKLTVWLAGWFACLG